MLSTDDIVIAVHGAANRLAILAVALDEANIALPYDTPRCENGVDVAAVYFGAADAVRYTADALQEIIDRV